MISLTVYVILFSDTVYFPLGSHSDNIFELTASTNVTQSINEMRFKNILTHKNRTMHGEER